MIVQNFDTRKRPLLVAEIGNNHEGDASLAMELVAAAAEAGVDAVKAQVINPAKLVNRSEEARIAQLGRFRLPLSVFAEMASFATRKGVLFVASAFDSESLESVAELLAAVKIASGDLDFRDLLCKAGQLGKPILLSTGGGTLEEIERAIEVISFNFNSRRKLDESLALLHCVSLYPTPALEANLRAIETLQTAFNLTIGYSDHTLGIDAAIVSLGLGARIVEKHFTLDKTRTSFRDHALSADPDDMRRLAAVVHSFDDLLGHGRKEPTAAERKSLRSLRRSIVASRDLPAGTRLVRADLDFLRPRGDSGLSPMIADRLLGRTLRVALTAHDLVLEDQLDCGT